MREVHVLRRDGAIIGVFANPPADPAERAASEILSADHPDVIAFETRPPPAFDPAKAAAQGIAPNPEARMAALEAEMAALKAGKGR